MASAPQQQLPLFYNALEPVSSEAHANFRVRPVDRAAFLAGQHAIPVTVDEFVAAQRDLPIVFTSGDDPIPIALMGLNEGVNVFFDDEGKPIDEAVYVPAYVRRYPFMLARLRPGAEELSLCFDPTGESVGAFEEGELLFEDGQPSQAVKTVLAFNEQFEEAGMRTANFMKEVREMGLLMEGEVTLKVEGNDNPFIYRGFQMINEEKLNELRGDQLRKISKSGLLPLLYAHLFSLTVVPQIFDRQVRQNKVPQAQLAG